MNKAVADGYFLAGLEHPGSDHGEVFTAPPAPPANYQRGKYNKTGLGEELVRMPQGGAVAYIGCNTGSQPCALTLQRGFVEAAAQPHIRLGDAWNEALCYYHQHERLAELKPDAGWYPPSIFFQGMKFMLFGDPGSRPLSTAANRSHTAHARLPAFRHCSRGPGC